MAEASSTEDVITLRIRFRSETVEKFAERYAADLTPNEIFIRTREPLPVGTTLALEFTLNDGSALISGRGSVAWTRGPEAAREGPIGMGIRFDALNGGSRQMLSRIMEAKARLTEAGGPFMSEPMQTPRAPRAAATPVAPPAPARGGSPARTLNPPPANQLGTPRTGTGVPARPEKKSESRPENRPDRAKNPFIDEDAEPTELASLPPFFYETGSDQEKTRLQDPRDSAALLQRDLAEAEDDITNPRAKIPPSFTGAGRGPLPADGGVQARGGRSPASSGADRLSAEDLIATRETKLPTFPAATSESRSPTFTPIGAPNQTDNHPLILSSQTATKPIPADVVKAWRAPTPPASAAVSPPGNSSFQPEEPGSDEVFWGTPRSPEVPPPAAEPRWGGSMETMATMPQLPPVMGIDPNVGVTPAWPVPAVDPHAEVPDQAAEEEARHNRYASIKMWVALTLAAGGVLAAALLLLPAVLRPSPQLAQTPPPVAATEVPGAQATSPPGTTVPTTVPPAAPATTGETAAAPDPSAAAKPAGETPPAAAVAVPTIPVVPAAAAAPAGAKPGEAKPGEAKPAPARAERKPAPGAPEVWIAGVKKRPAARPGRLPRNLERPAVAEAETRPAGTPEGVEPAAAATPATAPAPATPPPGIQGEGSEEVYWLTIRSVPAGADVLIDGQVEGKTPFVRRIFDPTRSYALSIRRAGFEPLERTLGSSDVWTKRGNVRTLTVVAKLTAANPASGPPAAETAAPPRTEPNTPPPTDPPTVAPPPVEPERKTNPFAEPPAPGGAQPNP